MRAAGNAINNDAAVADKQDVTWWESAEEQCCQWEAQGFHAGCVSCSDKDGGMQGVWLVGAGKGEADASINQSVGAIVLRNPGKLSSRVIGV